MTPLMTLDATQYSGRPLGITSPNTMKKTGMRICTVFCVDC